MKDGYITANIDPMVQDLIMSMTKVTKDIEWLEKCFWGFTVSEDEVKDFTFALNNLLTKIK